MLAALVDNQLKELRFEIYIPHNIKFIDYSHPDGYSTYTRSLYFVLQKAMYDLYPQYSLILDYTMQNGMYGELREPSPSEDGVAKTVILSEDEISAVRKRMQDIINADLPFTRQKIRSSEAIIMFKANNRPEKAFLHKERGKFFTTVYFLDGYADHYYGPLLNSTGMLTVFNFESFSRGFFIQAPSVTRPYELVKTPYQYKLFDVFKEYSDWSSILGVKSIGTLNYAINKGHSTELIQIAEALHERKYADIADEIYRRRDKIKLVSLVS